MIPWLRIVARGVVRVFVYIYRGRVRGGGGEEVYSIFSRHKCIMRFL